MHFKSAAQKMITILPPGVFESVLLLKIYVSFIWKNKWGTNLIRVAKRSLRVQNWAGMYFFPSPSLCPSLSACLPPLFFLFIINVLFGKIVYKLYICDLFRNQKIWQKMNVSAWLRAEFPFRTSIVLPCHSLIL